MESNSSSFSAPLPKSRVRALTILPRSPSETHKLMFTPLLFFFFFFLFFCINFTTTASTSTTQTSDFETLYSQHCNDVVPKSAADPSNWFVTNFSIQDIGFETGYFTGGDRLLNQNHLHSGFDYLKALLFQPSDVGKTLTDGIYKVRANLHLQDTLIYSIFRNSTHRNLRLFKPRIPVRKSILNFRLDGFYSESSKKLCMVGQGGSGVYGGNIGPFGVVLKLNYPQNSTIYDSLITGTLESLTNNKHDSNSFEPVLMLALSQRAIYEYTFGEKDRENGCLSGYDRGESLALKNLNNSSRGMCRFLGNRVDRFELEYGSDCGSVNCNPLGGDVGYMPNFLVYHGTRCTDGRKMQIVFGFSNPGYDGIRFPFEPKTTFIAEGEWDEKENRLCAVACRILNSTESLTNAFVGDCSTKFSLRFPARLSLQNRSTIVGQIFSNKDANDSGYFGKIGFRNSLSGWLMKLLDFKYEYFENDTLSKTCAEKKTGRGNGKRYPDEFSLDMKFGMRVRNGKGQVALGYSSPLFVEDDQIYGRRFWDNSEQISSIKRNKSHSSPMNISYKLSFRAPPDFNFLHDVFPYKAELSMEGIYDRDHGNLCMIGCRHILSENQNLTKKDMLDCAIKISVQFSPLDTKNDQNVKGTIESTREKSDPLYFEHIEFSSNSINTGQAAASISRIDSEIIMVLISNTLTCVFVGLQLFYVKKHPGVLPFISIVMLIVLTLGHMIPLLVNFEALFVPSYSQQNTFLGTGGWLEVNAVIVRVIVMVALLLQLRLLQLTWSSRQGDGNQESLRDSERKVLYVTLPLYIAGALMVWFMHQGKKNTYQRWSHRRFDRPHLRKFERPHHRLYRVSTLHHLAYRQPSLWEDLQSYAGFILDGFLFPQILFNLFFNSGEKALASAFYIGTTALFLLPHAYDLYRAHTYSTWFLDISYIYANHRMNFYSTAWNIIIVFGGLLFAAIIFMQQRFGGRCILPERYRQSSVYEKVPVISNEEL